jgi:GNAT superfamily N-acetyltransferase
MEIRTLTPSEIPNALGLVWEVFQEFEAPDYAQQGVDKFKECLDDPDFIGRLAFYGAFIHGLLAGVMATRESGSHIAMFFVRRESQRRGVGRRLFEHAIGFCPGNSMTVNSSPYAVPIYGRLGFTAAAGEQTTDGIRFTPMEYRKE